MGGALLAGIQSEHAPPPAAVEGSMLRVVIEDHYIPCDRLERHGRHLRPADARLPQRRVVESRGVGVADAVAARDYTQGAAVGGEWVEVEGDLDVHGVARGVAAITMPAQAQPTIQQTSQAVGGQRWDDAGRRGGGYQPVSPA